MVKERVSNYGSYQMGSHVLQFGDMSFTSDPVGTYIGFRAEDEAYELAPFARRLLAEVICAIAIAMGPVGSTTAWSRALSWC